LGKIAVVPSVNLEYCDAAAKFVKVTKGYVSDWMAKGNGSDSQIGLEIELPAVVKYMPTFTMGAVDKGLKKVVVNVSIRPHPQKIIVQKPASN
jgi:hypothetical protein